MNRRFLIMMLLAGLTLVMCSSCETFASKQVVAKRPNIIFVLADDLGYGDLGCFGQKMIKTPNIDQMAAEGIRFTQHYAGSTVCAPSRCSLMTGKDTGHCTVRGNVDVLLKDNEVTLAKLLRDNGYFTACVGKWGIGHPPSADDPHRNGFDHFFGYLSMWQAHNYYPEFLTRNRKKVKLGNVVERPKEHYKEGQRELTGVATKKVDYSHDLFTEEDLALIGQKRQPFFLFMSYTIPHANDEAEWFDMHGMEVPDLGQYKDKDWPEVEKAKAAMITRLDRDMGRLFAQLKDLGIEKNTLVIFTSDNGPHMEGRVDPKFFDSNGPLRGIKRDLYEGGIRVPMIARWPGRIPAGTESDHISAFWDYLPTFADLAGVAAPADIDGISMVPALMGKASQPRHEFLYWEFKRDGVTKQAVRIGNFKAVRLKPSADVEIYDLSTDIGERHNIADKNPAIVNRAKQIFKTEHTDPDHMWPLVDPAK